MLICKVILSMTASWLLRDATATCIVVEFTVNYLVVCIVIAFYANFVIFKCFYHRAPHMFMMIIF